MLGHLVRHDRHALGGALGAALLSSPGAAARRRLGLRQARLHRAPRPRPCRRACRCRWCSRSPIPRPGISPTSPTFFSSLRPANLYGLLQDTGTQRTLFEQPTVKDLTGAPPGSLPAIQLPSGVAPALADLGSLLGATGMFPDICQDHLLPHRGDRAAEDDPARAVLHQGARLHRQRGSDHAARPGRVADRADLRRHRRRPDRYAPGTSPPRSASISTRRTRCPTANGRNWWLTHRAALLHGHDPGVRQLARS